MQIGILSDTHNRLDRTRVAVEMLCAEGAEILIHCGDITEPHLLTACAVLPMYFVFGNNDSDSVPHLEQIAQTDEIHCLGWGGEITLAEKRIAVVHGHLTSDLRPLLKAEPDYLLSGHSHEAHDHSVGRTRRINPGALHRAREYCVAMLNLETDDLNFLQVPR